MKVFIRKHIDTDFIRLDAFLKLCGAVSTGGEAKMRIQNGECTLNGRVCLSRGKKLVAGDEVDFAGKSYRVYADQ